MLIEILSLKREELDSLRRQLQASTTSALNAQSRLQAYTERPSHSSLLSDTPVSTPLTRPTATPTSGVTTQLLPDPLSFMYAVVWGKIDEIDDPEKRIDLIDRRHLDDPGTVMIAEMIELYDRQDLGD